MSIRSLHNGAPLVEFEGSVLDIYERNGRDDSDFFAIVWDEAAGHVRDVMYATTRGGGDGAASIDATDEAKAKAAAYWRATHRATVEAKTRRDCEKPFVGATVTVKRGRKVPKGTTGVVIHSEVRVVHTSRYGTWDTREQFILIDGPTGAWTVAAKNCDMEPDPALVEATVAAALAKFDAQPAYNLNSSWRSMPYQGMYLAGVNMARVR